MALNQTYVYIEWEKGKYMFTLPEISEIRAIGTKAM